MRCGNFWLCLSRAARAELRVREIMASEWPDAAPDKRQDHEFLQAALGNAQKDQAAPVMNADSVATPATGAVPLAIERRIRKRINARKVRGP